MLPEEITNKAEGGEMSVRFVAVMHRRTKRGGLQSDPSMCEQANTQMKKGVKLHRQVDDFAGAGLFKSE